MRYVVLGAGAIGGVIGGRLALAGCDVTLIARGAHLEALVARGLELREPDATQVLELPAVSSPAEASLRDGDCVLLCTKTQQSEVALDELRTAAGDAEIFVCCAQNGIENERLALRRFAAVYGMRVILAGTHLEPGVVEVATAPVYGVLDVGCYPRGRDTRCDELAADLRRAGFDAQASEAVMSLKHRKLLSNLANALQAVAGDGDGPAAARVRSVLETEGRACLAAAGLEVAGEEDEAPRRERRGPLRPVAGALRRGSSSWQSLTRQTGDVEADFLNGEVVLLGRLHGVATPANSLLQRLAVEAARKRQPPGTVEIEEIVSLLGLRVP